MVVDSDWFRPDHIVHVHVSRHGARVHIPHVYARCTEYDGRRLRSHSPSSTDVQESTACSFLTVARCPPAVDEESNLSKPGLAAWTCASQSDDGNPPPPPPPIHPIHPIQRGYANLHQDPRVHQAGSPTSFSPLARVMIAALHGGLHGRLHGRRAFSVFCKMTTPRRI